MSAISYLNTAPLMWDFDHGLHHQNFAVSYTLPSQCAEDLGADRADIGLIPAAAYVNLPGLAIIPGIAIASFKRVRSILLVSKLPLEEVKSVALDTSSMTSVALTKVLFSKWLGGARDYAAMLPDIEAMLKAHDAALVIGDPALRINRSRHLTFDLAEEWNRFTGKPFVFAFWTVRDTSLKDRSGSSDLAEVFQRSRDNGLAEANVRDIAGRWAPKLGITEASALSYLRDNIYYYLDSVCLDGLRLFYRYAEECGALPRAPDLRFLGAEP